MTPSTLPSPLPERFSLADRLYDWAVILWEHRYKIVAIFVVVTVAGLWEALRRPDVFESRATLLIESGREQVYRAEVGPEDTTFIDRDIEARINAELQIVQSQDLARRLVATFGPSRLYPDLVAEVESDGEARDPLQMATESFQEALSVRTFERSPIIEVALAHGDAQIAADALTLFVSLFKEQHIEVFGEQDLRTFLQDHVDEYQRELNQSEVELTNLKLESGRYAFEDERGLLVRQRQSLDTELKRARSDLAGLEQQVASLSNQISTVDREVVLYSEANPAVERARSDLLTLRLEEKELLATFRETSRPVRNIRERIRLAEDFVAQQESAQQRVGPNEIYAQLQSDLIRLRSELQAKRAHVATLSGQTISIDTSLASLAERESRFRTLERQRLAGERRLDVYSQRLEDSEMAELMDEQGFASIRVVENPSVPRKSVAPNRKLILAVSMALGLFLGLAAAFLIHELSPAIGTPEKLESLGLPVLVTIDDYEGRPVRSIAYRLGDGT